MSKNYYECLECNHKNKSMESEYETKGYLCEECGFYINTSKKQMEYIIESNKENMLI